MGDIVLCRYPALLHNMSAPSKTTIVHTGTFVGSRVGFDLPRRAALASPRGLLSWIGVTHRRLTPAAAAQELTDRIEAQAALLPLPPVAAILTDRGANTTGLAVCPDPLTILTVLAKSSERVYLRAKTPILAGLVPGRRLVLVLPADYPIPADWRTA